MRTHTRRRRESFRDRAHRQGTAQPGRSPHHPQDMSGREPPARPGCQTPPGSFGTQGTPQAHSRRSLHRRCRSPLRSNYQRCPPGRVPQARAPPPRRSMVHRLGGQPQARPRAARMASPDQEQFRLQRVGYGERSKRRRRCGRIVDSGACGERR